MAGNIAVQTFANVVQLVDDVQLFGEWSGNDAIMVEDIRPRGKEIVGARGDVLVNRPAGRVVKITLKFMPGSSGDAVLRQADSNIDSGAQVSFAYSVTDTSSGEGGASTAVTILEAPSTSLGEEATDRTWVLVAADWQPHAITYTT